MDVIISQSQINSILYRLFDITFGELRPKKGSVDYEIIFINSDNEAVIGISSNFDNVLLYKYLRGEKRSLPKINNVYIHIPNSYFKKFESLFPISSEIVNEYLSKYINQKYGIKGIINRSVYSSMYLNRETEFLKLL